MGVYTAEVERLMQRLYRSLNERDRRRYAAVEAAKFGHGGIESVVRVLGCDAKTIRHGGDELQGEDELGSSDRQRKKGGDAKR